MRLVAAGWSISSHLPQESPGASCFEWSRRGFASILADQGDPYQPVLWAGTGAGISRQRHTPPIEQEASIQPHALRPPQQTEYPPGLCVVYPVNAEYT
jgi:hypothetical protein